MKYENLLPAPFRILRLAGGALLALCLLPAAPVRAAGGTLVPYQGEPKKLSDRDLLPTLSGAENYYEQYNFEGELGPNKPFYLRLRIANLGPGDGRMEVTLRARHPVTDQQFKYFEKFDRDGWSSSRDRFEIKAGRTRVWWTVGEIHLQGSDKGFSYDLRFIRQAEGWQPGAGRVRFDEGYYATAIVFPRAEIRGTFTVNGSSQEVQGWGHAIHTHSERAPYQVARRWVQFDSHDSEYAVYLRQFVPAEGLPQQPVSFLLITYQDRVVFQSYKVRLRAEQTSADNKTEAKYLMPRRLVFEAEAPGQKVQGILEGTELYHRSAMLEEVNAVERMVIKQWAEPVDYNYRCNYKIRLENQGHPPVDVQGRATYSINYLNR